MAFSMTSEFENEVAQIIKVVGVGGGGNNAVELKINHYKDINLHLQKSYYLLAF